MGEVYRATDSKLGRDVALKVLPAEMAADSERLNRFQREARTLAALDHPGIVGVFSVEEADGVHFLTMQLVEGESLDHLIPEGGFPLDQLLDIAVPLSDALAAAHERNIVHRDLKPANVMVAERGRVKVLDFGLAKLTSERPLDAAGREQAAASEHPMAKVNETAISTMLGTVPGIVMGTVPYMSPEQVSGKPVDHRTDIFSLGIILYEMASGRRPFHGDSSAELITSILRDSPPAVTELRADLPRDLARIIRRCLEKDTRDRYQTSRDVYNDLKELRAEVSSPSPRPGTASGARPSSGSIRADEGFWVAVLPFKYSGANADLIALAEGLTEDIAAGLSRFSYLRVVARGSSGKEPDARYVMEGSLRHAGGKLRVAVQVVDTATGAHLWAENYEREFSPEEVFQIQDDLVPRIVSTVADMNGALPRSMSEAVRSRPPEQLSPYEAVLRSFGYFEYFERVTPDELAAARSGLESVVRKAPAYADAQALLALLCCQDYAQGFGLDEDSLAKGLTAARRAVEAGPSNPLAQFSLAQALFFHKEFESFRRAAERAAALNPADGVSIAFLGELLTYAGDRERGLELAGRAKQLNPNHPGWYWYANFFDAYRRGDDRAALDFAIRADLPGHYVYNVAMAACYGQLGQREDASGALRRLLQLRPGIAATMSGDFEKWWPPDFVERLIDGLRKAGLEIAPGEGAAAASGPGLTRSSAKLPTSAPRAVQGFWVAVLPFKIQTAGADVESFAVGLAEDITTGLSRFRYLSVVARDSAARLKGQPGDVRALAAELGARYALEGGIRKAGTAIRVSARLLDTHTGTQLWAGSYDRDLAASGIFDVQDDIAARIVATVADSYGVLVRSMTAALEQKADSELSPSEWLFQYFAYRQQLTPAAHAALKSRLERAAERDARQSDLWACLAMVHTDEYTFGFQADSATLDRALAEARRAVELDRTNQFSLLSLAQAHFFRQELAAFHPAAEQAMALNPLNTDALGILGLMIVHTAQFQRGAGIVRRAMELNPSHAGWFHFGPIWEHFERGEYERSLEHAMQVNMPGLFWQPLVIAAICGLLGRRAEGAAAVRDLLALDPEFEKHARRDIGVWHFASGLLDRILEGVRNSGLDVDAASPKDTSPTSPS